LPTTTAAPLPTEAAPLPIAEAGQAEKQTAEQGKATQASMSLQDLVAELEAKQRQLRALDERQKGLAELGAKQPELKEVTEAQQFNEQAAASEGLDFSSLPGLPPLFALPEPGAAPEPTLTRVYNAPAAPAAASPALEDCRTPIEGDDCYEEVLYAKQTGVVNHPHWYGNLTPDSSFDDFQWLLHSVSRVCPRPCAAQVQQLPTQARLPAAPSPLAASTKRAPAARAAPATSTRPHAAPPSALAVPRAPGAPVARATSAAPASASEDCHTSSYGEECYEEVLYAMRTGVVKHPVGYYDNLTRNSSFEDFQRHLHGVSKVCPEPCAAQAKELPPASGLHRLWLRATRVWRS